MELYKLTKIHSLTFYVKLSQKSEGMGLNLALLKDNFSGDPVFWVFFLKCQIIAHETKTKNLDFNVRFF